jgi:hypothetical protein
MNAMLILKQKNRLFANWFGEEKSMGLRAKSGLLRSADLMELFKNSSDLRLAVQGHFPAHFHVSSCSAAQDDCSNCLGSPVLFGPQLCVNSRPMRRKPLQLDATRSLQQNPSPIAIMNSW